MWNFAAWLIRKDSCCRRRFVYKNKKICLLLNSFRLLQLLFALAKRWFAPAKRWFVPTKRWFAPAKRNDSGG